jgi:hypothetical protein
MGLSITKSVFNHWNHFSHHSHTLFDDVHGAAKSGSKKNNIFFSLFFLLFFFCFCCNFFCALILTDSSLILRGFLVFLDDPGSFPSDSN